MIKLSPIKVVGLYMALFLAACLVMVAICHADNPIYIKNSDGSVSEVNQIDPVQRKAEIQAGIDQDKRQIKLAQQRIIDLQSDLETKQKELDSLQAVQTETTQP